jgi:hypothetical protein
VAGARSWTLPGAIAVRFKITALLGLPRPAGYLALTRTVLSLASVGAVYFSRRLARRLGASRSAAIAGAALIGLGAVPVYFSPRGLRKLVRNRTVECRQRATVAARGGKSGAN